MKPLISSNELIELLSKPGIVIIDARGGPSASNDYTAAHIPGALFIDLEKQLSRPVIDAADGGRHPLPSTVDFGKTLGQAGITSNTHVIAYDDKGGANAASRLWWMLKAGGHEKVQVLDGGIQAAQKAGIILTDNISVPVATNDYIIDEWKLPIADIKSVEKAAKDPAYLVIDVRDAYRYLGEREPIDKIAGRIPGAVNVPLTGNLANDGLFLSAGELSEKYKDVVGDRKMNNVIVHCGSGVTACHTLLALEQAGLPGANLYVGSWSEWSNAGMPVAIGKE